MNEGFLKLGLDKLNENDVNSIIKANKLDTNKISDGYHTFKQLYDHRTELYIQVCKALAEFTDPDFGYTWRSKKHSDGGVWEGWFLLGIGLRKGRQITYHLPIDRWKDCDFVAETRDFAPPFDGHTADDVLDRLKDLEQYFP